MMTDGVAICAWIVTFIKDSTELPGRAALAVAALFGFISTLLAALAVGLFSQAVDVFNDTSITLGWPFYLVIAATFLAFVTTVLAAWSLYEGRREERKEEERKMEAQMAIIDFYRNRGHGSLDNLDYDGAGKAGTPRTQRRAESRENLESEDEERQQEMCKKGMPEKGGYKSRDHSPDRGNNNFRRGDRDPGNSSRRSPFNAL